MINVNNNALAAHTAHGDALPGMPVPNMTGYEFSETCQIVLTPILDFFPFYIRNNNTIPLSQRISPPWDADMMVAENAAGEGFSAATPQGGQKVGYGTNYYDGVAVNEVNTVNWTRVSGAENLVAYLNLWVTDGTNYAVIASENDYRGQPFATRQEWKVFEFDSLGSLNWLCANGVGARDGAQYLTCGGIRATMADIANNVIINSPTGTYPGYVGTGAPRGGYGFNLIWGDTSVNFLGAYSLSNLSVTVSGVTTVPTTFDAPTN